LSQKLAVSCNLFSEGEIHMLVLKDFSREFRKMALKKSRERVLASRRFWKAIKKAKKKPEKTIIVFKQFSDTSTM
jgi:hypothetical protein